MKRSEVNWVIKETLNWWKESGVALPPWAFYSPEVWRREVDAGHVDIDKMIKRGQGLYLSNFPVSGVRMSPNFSHQGTLSITVEDTGLKFLYQRQNQAMLLHKHLKKEETVSVIGNSTVGRLVVRLYRPNESDGSPNYGGEALVKVNNLPRTVNFKQRVSLAPGESITFPAGVWHHFYASADGVSLQAVSSIHEGTPGDDDTFMNQTEKFIAIEPDVPPEYLLGNELKLLVR